MRRALFALGAVVALVGVTASPADRGVHTPGTDLDRAVPYHADYLFWVPCPIKD